VALARVIQKSRPDLVARLFLKLDKTLKMTGDKHLVLDVAQLSIEAAHDSARTREVVEGEAQAQVCGICWVFQRIRRLEEARTYAKRSLDLGQQIGWDRNTAFCTKCIGRLYRMEAEATADAATRASLLGKSVDTFKKAIELFSQMTAEFGPDHPEVGDCYSLLGRTHLVAGRVDDARNCAEEAIERIPQTELKDYSDLQILLGDIEVARRQTDSAIQFYDRVITTVGQTTPEHSEILARALVRRASAYRSLGKVTFAIQDYRRAAQIWKDLHEEELSAEAEWGALVLEQDFPPRLLQRFEKEQFLTRVIGARLFQQEIKASNPGSRGRRIEPTDPQLNDLTRRAKQQAALERIPW